MDQSEIDLEKSVPVNDNDEPKQSLNEWLVAQRQNKGLSTQDVASRTNRHIQQIMALEAGDYSHMTPTLLRAVVRHYAKAIGVDSEEAITYLPVEYQKTVSTTLAREAEVNKVFTHHGTPLKSPWISRTAMIILLLAVLGLLAYWVFGARLMKPSEGVKKVSEPNQVQVVTPAAPAPVASPPANDGSNAANTLDPAAPVVGIVVAPDSTAPASTETDAKTPLATSGDELLLKFKATSWVEIRDADGKILLSGEQAENTEQPISGKLPLKVKIGNATQVDANWKNSTYDLAPFTKGGVARFSLE